MKIILFALLSTAFLLTPQLLTLRHRYLCYLVTASFPDVSICTAEDTFIRTNRFIAINNRWDNLRLRRLKKISTLLGVLGMIFTLVVSFHNPADTFLRVTNLILGAILWIALERLSLECCFKYLHLKPWAIYMVALFAPFVLFGLIIVTLYAISSVPLNDEFVRIHSIMSSLYIY